MMILKILGILASIAALYFLIKGMQAFIYKVYRYELFNWKNYVITTIGYVLIYIGYKLFNKALESHGDLLNGELLFGIGVIFVLYVIYDNIKHTSVIIGGLFTLVQLVLYVGLAAVGLFVLFAMFAMYAGAKPVYRID